MNKIKCLIVALGAACLHVTHGAIVLEIDISDPSAVVFTAIANNASANNTSFPMGNGVLLYGFFSSASTSLLDTTFSSGNLAFASGGDIFSLYAGDDSLGGYSSLNIYSYYADSTDASTSTSSAPFLGSSIVDMSSMLSVLPSVGDSGDIQPGYETTAGDVFGQWVVVVPEPSTWAAMCGGLVLGLACLPRMRRKSVAA